MDERYISNCPNCNKSLITGQSKIRCICGHTYVTTTKKISTVCPHRGRVIGIVDYGCQGKHDVYECELYQIAITRRLKFQEKIRLFDGSQPTKPSYCNICDKCSLGLLG